MKDHKAVQHQLSLYDFEGPPATLSERILAKIPHYFVAPFVSVVYTYDDAKVIVTGYIPLTPEEIRKAAERAEKQREAAKKASMERQYKRRERLEKEAARLGFKLVESQPKQTIEREKN